MNKIQKKIIPLSLVLIMCILCVSIFATKYTFSASAMNAEETVTFNSVSQEKLSKSVTIYDKAMSQFSSTKNADENNINTYSEDFGGVFIDDNNVLNIGIVCNDVNSLSKKKLNDYAGQVIYKPHSFSYNYLMDVYEAVVQAMDAFEISRVSIKESLNQVFIYTDNQDNITEISSYLEAQNLYTKEALNFVIESESKATATSNTAYGGYSLYYDYEGTTTPEDGGTIGASVRCNKTGAYGIITNAHVALENKVMKHDRVVLGVRDRGQFSGTVDAAFVPFSDQSAWQTTPYAKHMALNDIYTNIRLGSESQIVEGQTVKRIGQETQITTGRITSKTITAKVKARNAGLGVKDISNMFEYDNAPMLGDSGGPVYFDDGSNLYLLGLNTAKSEEGPDRGYACRISEVMRVLDVSPITNDPLPLNMEVVEKHGWAWPDWSIRLKNPNNFPVSVVYNGRMCFEDSARYFRNLDSADESYVEIAANSSEVVRINGNGTARWITAAISFYPTGSSGGFGLMVSYTDGLSESGLNVPYVNPVVFPSLQAMSPPTHLGLDVTARYGWLWYDWDIRLSNPNDRAVAVTYNERMCFEGDAKNFTGLSNLLSISIPAYSSVVVRINSNGSAGWITSSIEYMEFGTIYVGGNPMPIIRNMRAISCANDLGSNPNKLTRYTYRKNI